MRLPFATTRALQIGLLFLLLVSFAQVLWWTLDQWLYSTEIRQRFTELYEGDVHAAEAMLAGDADATTVEKIFPHLTAAGEAVRIRPEALAALDSERYHRLRRYRWEGGFFIAVLGVSMAVLWHALRLDAQLRQRQQNFIAAVSHELKSPLASLQLSAETMAMRELSPERTTVLVRRILDDVQRMEDMVSKILNTSRLEHGRIELNPEPLSLRLTVSAVLTALDRRAAEAGVHVEVEVPETLIMRADPVAARTVVQNLVENAVKATAAVDGGRVELRGEEKNGFVELAVRDTGIGFPPAESRKLFEKFYRPGNELRRTSTGTGLGLFIVHRLMHHQRGRVTAHSNGPGEGAVFTVSWPAAAEMET